MIPTRPRAAASAASLLLAVLAGSCTPDAPQVGGQDAATEIAANRPDMLDLWESGQTAFGIYVPDERPRAEGPRDGERLPPLYTVEGGRRLAENPLVDFAFLNLEGAYNVAAVRAIAEGIRAADTDSPPTLLVRIPSIAADGADATRARVREVLELGADGVVLPHVRGADEARTAVGFFADAGADVWSSANPDGDVVAMLMVEDAGALAEVEEIAAIPGYSVLACGIGSLTRALDGDRAAAEGLNQKVLALATEAGMADMITADAESVARRVDEGFLALLMQGPTADSVIRLGRAALMR